MKNIDYIFYETEAKNIAKRKQIEDALQSGMTYRQIQDAYGVSSSTISTVKKHLKAKEQGIWKQ